MRQEMLVVVKENAGRVTLFDLQTEAILYRIEVDSLPHEVEVSPFKPRVGVTTKEETTPQGFHDNRGTNPAQAS